ncbi:MAG: T9SS type A sorting domain-containing protein [Bacteroidales bacterium]
MKRFIFLLVISLFAVHAATGQVNPNWFDVKKFSSAAYTNFGGSCSDSKGNTFVFLSSSDSALFYNDNQISVDTLNGTHSYIIKLDALGKLVWLRKMAVATMMGGANIGKYTTDDNGNLIILVSVMGEMGAVDLVLDDKDIISFPMGYGHNNLLIRYDKNGQRVFTKKMASPLNGYYFVDNLIVDRGNNIYLAGSNGSDTLDFGDGVVLTGAAYQQSFYVAKMDANGKALWAVRDSGDNSGTDYIYDVRCSVDKDGNLAVTGDFQGAYRKLGSLVANNHNPGTRDVFLALFDKDGKAVSITSFGGLKDETVNGLDVSVDGSLILSGWYSSQDIPGLTKLDTTFFLFINKYSSLWAPLWQTSLALANQYTGSSPAVVLSPDGGVSVTAPFQGISTDFGTGVITNHASDLSTDVLLAKINSAGVVSWTDSWGTTFSDYPGYVSTDPLSSFYYSQVVNSTATYSSADTLVTGGSSGFVIRKMDAAGKILWKATLIPNYSDQASVFQLGTNASGYLYVIGSLQGTEVPVGSTLLSSDGMNSIVFMARLSIPVSGKVFDKDGGLITSGQAILFSNNADKRSVILDTAVISDGNYSFAEAPVGGFIVLAVPDAGLYPDYIPTYSGGNNLWENSLTLDAATATESELNITVKYIAPVVGPGTIRGTVTDESVKKSTLGNPVKSAGVILIGRSKKAGGEQVIKYTTTDDAGFYQFAGVPEGDYYIRVEVTGLSMLEVYDISITSLNASVENANYKIVNSGILKDNGASSSQYKGAPDKLLVFPNPTSGMLEVRLTGTLSAGGIEIYSLTGALVKTQEFDPSFSSIKLNLNGLPEGVYHIRMRTDSGIQQAKIVLIRE